MFDILVLESQEQRATDDVERIEIKNKTEVNIKFFRFSLRPTNCEEQPKCMQVCTAAVG